LSISTARRELRWSAAHVVTFENARGDQDASNTAYIAVKAELLGKATSKAARGAFSRLVRARRSRSRRPQLAHANPACNAERPKK